MRRERMREYGPQNMEHRAMGGREKERRKVGAFILHGQRDRAKNWMCGTTTSGSTRWEGETGRSRLPPGRGAAAGAGRSSRQGC